jgi:amidophosphoribosyltransferase
VTAQLPVPDENPPGEECGVFGVWAPGEEVAKLTYYGLYALQHRGQEAAGIAVADGSQVLVFKDLGLVSQVFDEQTLAAMEGHVAIGHCRTPPAAKPRGRTHSRCSATPQPAPGWHWGTTAIW